MFHPSGHSPDEARKEMSGYILSAEGQESRNQAAGNETSSHKPLFNHISTSLLLSSSFDSLNVILSAPPSLLF